MFGVLAENIFVVLSILAVGRGIYVVKDECPPNEEYLLCGPACPVNCSSPTAGVCSEDCVEGCFCTAGFIRDSNGTCVAPDKCGTPLPACPNNEEYTCGSCPATCSQPIPDSCFAACQFSCHCKGGFVRDDTTGKCVALEDCPIEPCLNENETYDPCNGDCEPSCTDPEPICNKICMGGCICAPGLLRDSAGACVPVDQCPGNGTDVTLLARYLNAINKILHL